MLNNCYISSLTVLASIFFLTNNTILLAQNKHKTSHVVLVSIDGFRHDFYTDDKWPMPTVQKMAKTGVKAHMVKPVFPSVTLPAHTTMITGVSPLEHEIYYNNKYSIQGKKDRYTSASDIQVPTLWDITKKANFSCAAILWPVSAGAPIDFCIPYTYNHEGDHAYWNWEKMRELAIPNGYIEELEEFASGKQLTSKIFIHDLTTIDNTGAIAAYTLEKYKPNLLMVHFIATDEIQHIEGRNGPTVAKAVAATDRAIERIKEAAHRANILEETTFIITGDHGFVDVNTVLCPNVWLAKSGIINESNPERNKAIFHVAGASAFLHLADSSDKITLREVEKLLKNLPDYQKKLFQVLNREELNQAGADPAARLALNPIPGIYIEDDLQGRSVKSSSFYWGMHGYIPDFPEIHTGFIGWGAGFREGVTIPVMGLEDITPMIVRLLDLSPGEIDRTVYPGIFYDTDAP